MDQRPPDYPYGKFYGLTARKLPAVGSAAITF